MACLNHFPSRHPEQPTASANSHSRSPRQYLDGVAQHGELAFFNRNTIGADSIVFANSIITEGAFNHPVAIVGSIDNGTIATCALITSFRSGDIMTKYARKHLAARRRSYLPIDHYNQTQAHDDTPLLQLKNGRNMEKQSYLGLDGFFQIETKYLSAWRDRQNVLTTESLLTVQRWLMNFMLGGMEVPRHPSYTSCLTNGPILPIHFGLTVVPLFNIPSLAFQPIYQLSYVPPVPEPSSLIEPWMEAVVGHRHSGLPRVIGFYPLRTANIYPVLHGYDASLCDDHEPCCVVAHRSARSKIKHWPASSQQASLAPGDCKPCPRSIETWSAPHVLRTINEHEQPFSLAPQSHNASSDPAELAPNPALSLPAQIKLHRFARRGSIGLTMLLVAISEHFFLPCIPVAFGLFSPKTILKQ
nr:hypothetical protein CFP56_43937 [Quercus suber]